MIISASRRTDLPAFFPEWTIKEIVSLCKAEQESLFPSQTPKHGVVFWTKNPEPIIPYLHILDKKNIVYYFQYTLNDYPKEIEPNIPTLENRIKSYRHLGETIGFDKIHIRFDPILTCNIPGLTTISIQTLVLKYNNIVTWGLRKKPNRIIFSFLDAYPKLPAYLKPPTQNEINYIINYFIDHFYKIHNINLYSCAEHINNPLIKQNKCIDPEEFIKMGIRLGDPYSKDQTQRLLCGCYPSKDIGTYHTCKHDCSYCYAK